ncbi:hypothetical protein ACMV5L_01685 [Serratia plymuthica]|uniref:hypothetical protein n=1 Tax=Serratia plymuthica TaxID=82996 RepID=UPI003DA24385
MMNDTKQQHAYQRGVRIANLWKRLKGTILKWDAICVAKARNHKLPGWVGYVPIAIALFGSLTAALLGGAAIAGCLLFIWAIAVIRQNADLSNVQLNESTSDEESNTHDGYRNGPEGYGYYMGGFRDDDEI